MRWSTILTVASLYAGMAWPLGATAPSALQSEGKVLTKEEVVLSLAGDLARTRVSHLVARPGTTAPATILEVDVENLVIYVVDVPFPELTTNPAATNVEPKAFAANMGIGDIVAVNGKPAKGTWMLRATTILATPEPGPTTGIAIADTERLALVDQSFEVLAPDGTPIGTIMGFGPGFGPEPPGAPVATRLSNLAVVGGTGAFLGARGQLGTTGFSPDKPFPRFASASEIPALRRQNGGGVLNFIIHLVPMFYPEILLLPENRPAVFHASDHALVTRADPALPGEVLTMLVRGLGPTNPRIDPGKPFPRVPLTIVNSPVEILVNGTPAQLIFAGGEPGTVDLYDVEFRVPPTTASGTALIEMRVGFVEGLSFELPIE